MVEREGEMEEWGNVGNLLGRAHRRIKEKKITKKEFRRFNDPEMQTGLKDAIIAFEGMNEKLLKSIHRKRYLNYCILAQGKRLIKEAKHALNNEMIGLCGYVSHTPQKDIFYVRSWDIRAAISRLAMTPSIKRICEIISRETTNDKIIDELVKLYYEYSLISFHYVYLNNLTG